MNQNQEQGKCTQESWMSKPTSAFLVTRGAGPRKPVIAANFPGSAVKVVLLSERTSRNQSATKDELHSQTKLPGTEKEGTMQQQSVSPCSHPAGSLKIVTTSRIMTESEPSLCGPEVESAKSLSSQTSAQEPLNHCSPKEENRQEPEPSLCGPEVESAKLLSTQTSAQEPLNCCSKDLKAKCLPEESGKRETPQMQELNHSKDIQEEAQNNETFLGNVQPSKQPAFWISLSIPELLSTLPTASPDHKESKTQPASDNSGCGTDTSTEEGKTCPANAIKDTPTQDPSLGTDSRSSKSSATEAIRETSATNSGFPSTAFKISQITRKSHHSECDDRPGFELGESTDVNKPKNDQVAHGSSPQKTASSDSLTQPKVMTPSKPILFQNEENFLSEMDVEGLLGDRKGRRRRNRRRRSQKKSILSPKKEAAASFSFDVEALLLERETERRSRKRKKSPGRSSSSSTTTESGPFLTHSDCESNPEDAKPVKPKGKKREKTDMPKKLRPNAFVSVRIPSVQIRDKLKEVQDAMLSYERKLKSTFVSLEKLHLTLMVLRLEDTEMVEKAKAVLVEATKTVTADLHLHANPLVLEFTGVGSFGKRVVFASIKEGESKERLAATAEAVQCVFQQYGLPTTDKRPFNPHLTIAKVSQNSRRGVNQIKEYTYEEFTDFEFGSEVITGLELLSMTEPAGVDGYYHCFQRCVFPEP